MAWNHRIKVKHLFTRNEDYESVKASMTAIADALDADVFFTAFNTNRFRDIPQGDDVAGPVDYANRLLDRLYDYADDHRIWIE